MMSKKFFFFSEMRWSSEFSKGDHFLILAYTLPETNIAPRNGWLEYYFPIGFRPFFRGELLVSGRVV